MTKRQQQEYQHRAELNSAGWQVKQTDSIQFNHGSETPRHLALKAITGKVLRDHDYRVSSEVTHPEHGEIDILAYAGSEKAFAVELETNPSTETVESKLDRYVHSNQIIRECFILPVEDAPSEIDSVYDWVEARLF